MEIYIMNESDQRWRNELIKEMAKETRLPIARVLMITWAQLEKPNTIRTQTGREVILSDWLSQAIARLPRLSKWIFNTSPYPPIIPDEYLDPAREFIEKRKKMRFFQRKTIKSIDFLGQVRYNDINNVS